MHTENVQVLDTSCIIGRVSSIREADALAAGSIIGDLQGGLSFSDSVAEALEARSEDGWHEGRSSTGDIWTVIILDR